MEQSNERKALHSQIIPYSICTGDESDLYQELESDLAHSCQSFHSMVPPEMQGIYTFMERQELCQTNM